MGDLGSIFNDITGNTGSGSSAQKLAANGYQQFSPAQAPALNMGAYGPDQTTQADAAQINMGQANQFLGGEQGLVGQLQAQAQGSGPSLAQMQLKQGTQANLAASLSATAGQRGNQNPGAAQYALGQGAAAANQAAAGQAAETRGNEQLTAEQGLGQALGAYGGQQIGLAENQAGLTQAANLQNANAANSMAQFNTQSAQQGNAAQQSQYQFGTNIAATQQSNENAAIAGQQLANQNASNSFSSGLVGGGVNGAGALGASYAKPGGGNSNSDDDDDDDWAKGGVGEGTTKRIGEAGPEAVVKAPENHVHVHMHGGEVAPGQVVAHDVVGKIGHEGSKTVVVPLHDDGTPKTEAMDGKVKELLNHPDFQKSVAKVVHKHLADAIAAKGS